MMYHGISRDARCDIMRGDEACLHHLLPQPAFSVCWMSPLKDNQCAKTAKRFRHAGGALGHDAFVRVEGAGAGVVRVQVERAGGRMCSVDVPVVNPFEGDTSHF